MNPREFHISLILIQALKKLLSCYEINKKGILEIEDPLNFEDRNADYIINNAYIITLVL